MRRLRFLILRALLLTLPLWPTQVIHSRGQQVSPKEARLESILQTASVAPPELAADLLLQTVEKDLIKDRGRRIEILREAFDLAPGAKYALKGVSTGAGGSWETDTDIGMLSQAFGAGLDTMSVRVRAVQQMALLNPSAALQLFTQVPLPQVPGLSCKTALAYSVDDYYATVGIVYSKAFDATARKKKLDLNFLTGHLVNAGSPVELEPVARLLISLPLSQSALMEALSIYNRNLSNLQDDDRCFTAVTRYSLLDRMYELAQSLQRNGISAYGLVSALGVYIDGQLRGVRCADTASSVYINGVVDQFNKRFRQLGPEVEKVPPISADDLRPTRLGEAAEVYRFWTKPESKRLMVQYKRLRFGAPEEQANTDAPQTTGHGAPYLGLSQRKSDAWADEADTFLKNLDSWTVEDEPGTAGFHEKCLMYSALLDITPKGNFRHLVFTEYLAFLRNSPVETDSPPEWALHLMRLLKMRSEEDNSPFVQDVAESGDATMQLYAELSELTSSK